ncbi:MAG: ribonuclease R [Candidatus Rifleibacteriota bacterium]
MNLAAGSVVEFSDRGSSISLAAVLFHAGSNVRLFLPNGKETTITGKKVLHYTSGSVLSVADREICRSALQQIDEKRKAIAEEIDLAELHELLSEENKSFTLQELSGYLFSPDDADSVAALLRKLHEDKLYFRCKNDLYTPASKQEVERLKVQLAKKEAQEAEDQSLVEDLKAAARTGRLSESLRSRLSELKMYVAAGSEANINKRLASVLEKAGLANQRKLFSLLVACGEMDADENLLLLKYRVPVEFSRDLLECSRGICRRLISPTDFSGRLDLRRLRTWAIDTPGSKDRDDAFSIEISREGTTKLYVHVADPAEFIEPGSELDKEAARRGSSIYMPDSRIHMLPPQLSEELLSLTEGGDRLALTLILEFDQGLFLKNVELHEALISIDRATDYDTADQEIEADEWLQQALALAEGLKKVRAQNGAAMFPRQPELEVKVVDGEIVISRRSREDKTAGMIAEFMIWANHAAAEWCRKHAVPCLYRVQDPADENIEFGGEFEPVSFFAALRTFKKTVVSAHAGRHSSLGLESYTQITSPLRRYADLLLHRQIKAVLRGKPPAYNQNELDQAMMMADEAVSRADEIMREREKYFLHKYIKQMQKTGPVVFNGVVVDQSMNDVTFYVDFLCAFKHCRKPAFDVFAGQKVGVKVNQIDLFDGIIRFDLVQSC